MQYRKEGVPTENLMDIEQIHGCMPVEGFAGIEAWLKARENEGFEFTKCVQVKMDGRVIWLRGEPGEWNWRGNH